MLNNKILKNISFHCIFLKEISLRFKFKLDLNLMQSFENIFKNTRKYPIGVFCLGCSLDLSSAGIYNPHNLTF